MSGERGVGKRGCGRVLVGGQREGGGRLRGADAAEVGHAKGLKGAGIQARQMFGPIGFSVVGVLSADVFCLVLCLT